MEPVAAAVVVVEGFGRGLGIKAVVGPGWAAAAAVGVVVEGWTEETGFAEASEAL